MRLSPRIALSIPVEIECGSLRKDTLMVSLSVEGAFIRNSLSGLGPFENGCVIRYELGRIGIMEHPVKVVRKDPSGYGLFFSDIDLTLKKRLWQYLSDNLTLVDACPFCGQHDTARPHAVKGCGRTPLRSGRISTSDSPGRMAVVKRLEGTVGTRGAGDLQKLVNFVEGDLLKTKDAEQMQEFVGTSPVMLQVFSNIAKSPRPISPSSSWGRAARARSSRPLPSTSAVPARPSPSSPSTAPPSPRTSSRRSSSATRRVPSPGPMRARRGRWNRPTGAPSS